MNSQKYLRPSIYLLNTGKLKPVLKDLRKQALRIFRAQSIELTNRIYIFESQPKRPTWFEVLSPHLRPRRVEKNRTDIDLENIDSKVSASLFSQNPAAILLAIVDKQCFIISFGKGHTKLDSDWYEGQFGKTVALNIIPRDGLNECSTDQVFARSHQATEKAPMASELSNFGFDAERDQVKAIKGKPNKSLRETFGRAVSGGAAISFDLDFSKLPTILREASRLYDHKSLSKQWPEIDKFVEIKVPQKIAELDVELDKIINDPSARLRLYFSFPTNSGTTQYPTNFSLGRRSTNAASIPYLSSAAFVAAATSADLSFNLEFTKRLQVHALDDDGNVLAQDKMYSCIGYELSANGETFVLSQGTWYCVKSNFINDVRQRLSNIKGPTKALTIWNQIDHEGEFNLKAAESDPELILLDAKNISTGGGNSKIEFCDLLHLKTKTLYFVKKPSSASGLSHLVEQVRRTDENFFRVDESFRIDAAIKLMEMGHLDVSWLECRPKRTEWTICLVLMGKSLSELSFFSASALARLAKEYEEKGFTVVFQAV
jgi:uncharacterized protein (TIGR04141 family)